MKEIVINSKIHGTKTTLIDDEDYEYLMQWKWHISKSKDGFYVMRQKTKPNGKQYHLAMHRVMMKVSDSKIWVDHKDRDRLNNQKINLRKCTHSENNRNRRCPFNSVSKYTGVTLRVRKMANDRLYKVWVGCIASRTVSEPKKHFPYTEEGEVAAAKYYDQLAKKYYGEFANLNFK